MGRRSRLSAFTAAMASCVAFAAPAAEPCGICARFVVTNSDLADCFLEKYPELSARRVAAVAVDLADCETSRGVVAALRGPAAPQEEPSLRFMLSAAQLACLKERLEAPELVLDPSARIELDGCE